MHYRALGRTGLKLSQLGFGAMRLPMSGNGPNARVDRELAIPMMHRAFEAGVNYVDTATMYCNNDSQYAVGEALKGWRDKVILSTKNPYFGASEKEWWTHLEQSLKRLDVDYVDIYHHHGVNRGTFHEFVLPKMSKWMRKAVNKGLIRHICCSFHDNNDALVDLVDSGYPEVITLQYNLLDRQLEPGIARAREKGIGVIVMGPVGGGRLGAPNDVLRGLLPRAKSVPEVALRFVLANEGVSVALSGMSTMDQVVENLAVASDQACLPAPDKRALYAALDGLKNKAEVHCTGCAYCMPCPNDVNICGVFDAYNNACIYGQWEQARDAYSRMMTAAVNDGGRAADACTECGECLSKCPQHIDIPDQLAHAHKALLPAKG